MHTALCKLAYSGLAGRRRDTRMMLCVLAAAFALMTAMLCYAASGTRAQDETRKSIYGSWQIARYALDDEQAAQFVQSTAPTAVGKAQQYASLVNAQGLAFGALGTADERYFACGRLELLSGHLPQTSHEIALTTSVLDSLALRMSWAGDRASGQKTARATPLRCDTLSAVCCHPTMPIGRWIITCRWTLCSRMRTACPPRGSPRCSCSVAMPREKRLLCLMSTARRTRRGCKTPMPIPRRPREIPGLRSLWASVPF